MNISFYLKKYAPKPEPVGGSLIMAQITFNNKVVRKSTTEECLKKNWVGKIDKWVSTKQDFYYRINENLSSLKTYIMTFFNDCRQSKRLPTKEEVVAHYEAFFKPKEPLQPTIVVLPAPTPIEKPKPKNTTKELTISEAIQKYQVYKAGTDDIKAIKSDGYIRFFNQTINHLVTFGLHDTSVLDLGVLFWTDFTNSLFDAELEHNTVHGHIKRIKTVLGYCKNFLDLPVNKGYLEYKFSQIEPDIVFLLPSEIDLLHKLSFSPDDKEEQEMEQARDFFLFGCYVGARYSDLSSFTSANLMDTPKGKVLQYRPKKTKNTIVSIFLVEEALAILDKYPNQNKLLPFFKNDRINELIKPIAKRAGIIAKIQHTSFAKKRTTKTYEKWERLTMHCSRHTFATVCFLSGMTELTVQRFLGHTKIDTTKRYIHFAKSFEVEAMKNAWAKE